MHVLSTGRNPSRMRSLPEVISFFAGFSAASWSSVVKPDYFVQVVRGKKVVQETGGRLSVPQRVRLRHLKQLGHTFTRSGSVGAHFYLIWNSLGTLLQDLKQLRYNIYFLLNLKQLGHSIILLQDFKLRNFIFYKTWKSSDNLCAAQTPEIVRAHHYTRSEAVGAHHYTYRRSETVGAHHYTSTRSGAVGAHHYTSARSGAVGAQHYTSTRSETVGAHHYTVLIQDVKQLGHIIILQDVKQLGHRTILLQDLKQLGHSILYSIVLLQSLEQFEHSLLFLQNLKQLGQTTVCQV